MNVYICDLESALHTICILHFNHFIAAKQLDALKEAESFFFASLQLFFQSLSELLLASKVSLHLNRDYSIDIVAIRGRMLEVSHELDLL